jgi:hypothetical protein
MLHIVPLLKPEQGKHDILQAWKTKSAATENQLV